MLCPTKTELHLGVFWPSPVGRVFPTRVLGMSLSAGCCGSWAVMLQRFSSMHLRILQQTPNILILPHLCFPKPYRFAPVSDGVTLP